MNRRIARAAGLVALLMGAGTLVQPVHAVAPAPQNTCSGAFCVTFDLVPYDALAPTQPTTAAAQPTNLALRFTDTSPAVGADKSRWLAKVSAVLGSTSSKAFAVTTPDQLPLGAYVAGTAATASGCAAATDFAAACPAGSGTGLVEVKDLAMTPTIKTATFGISRITTGTGGAMTADLTVRIDGELLPSTTTTPLTFSPATATAGPTLTMDTRPLRLRATVLRESSAVIAPPVPVVMREIPKVAVLMVVGSSPPTSTSPVPEPAGQAAAKSVAAAQPLAVAAVPATYAPSGS